MLGGASLPPFQSSSSHRLPKTPVSPPSRPANLLSPPDIVLTPSPTEAEEESRPAAPSGLTPSPSSLPPEAAAAVAVRSRSNSRSKQLASPALEAVPEGPGENGSCGSCSSSDKDVVEDEENRLSVPSPTGGGGRRESSTSSTGVGGGEIEHGGRRESLLSPSAVCGGRRQSGSRRLSVGAMVSLSTLRAETGSRLTSKTIPIINPLVKNPNWPNLDRVTSAGRGLISLVVLTTADMLCAPVTPIMDWTPPPDRMEEIGVMNNYFGIGIDAKIALDFHNKREEQQSAGRPRSRAKNYIWYGMLGSKELVQK